GELQRDFDEVQQQLESQDEIAKQLAADLCKMERAFKLAKKQRDENRNIVEERDEDLYMLREEKESQDEEISRLRSEVEELRGRLTKSISSLDSGMVDASVQFTETDLQEQLETGQVEEVLYVKQNTSVQRVQVPTRDDTDPMENMHTNSSQSAISSVDSICSYVNEETKTKQIALQTTESYDKQEMDQLRHQCQKLVDELEATKDQLVCLRSQIAMHSLELETKCCSLRDAEDNVSTLQKQIDEAQPKLRAALAERDAAKQCSNQYAVQLDLIKENMARVQDTNQLLTTELQSLRQLKLDQETKLNCVILELDRLKAEYSLARNELQAVKETASKLATEFPQNSNSSRLNEISISLEFARKTTMESESLSRQLHELQKRLSLFLAEAQLQLTPVLIKTTTYSKDCWEEVVSTQSRRTVDGSSECLDPMDEDPGSRSHVANADSTDEDLDPITPPQLNGNTTAKMQKLQNQYSHLLRRSQPQNQRNSTLLTQSVKQQRRIIEQALSHIDNLISEAPNELHGSNVSLGNCSSRALSDVSCQTFGQNMHSVPLDKYRHIFAKFQRAESHRRALSYQKRYLLLCLGNFELPEEVIISHLAMNTLSPIALHMSSSEETVTGKLNQRDSFYSLPPLSKFRVYARVIMAIYRMHQIVHKWHTLGLKSSTVHTTSSLVTVEDRNHKVSSTTQSRIPGRLSYPLHMTNTPTSTTSKRRITSPMVTNGCKPQTPVTRTQTRRLTSTSQQRMARTAK
ncbi:hypothetical protein Ciccas_008799, partial [Cichlidogyrus casuarinus]